MPSFYDQMMNETDILPPKQGNLFMNNTNSIAYNEFRQRTGVITRNIQLQSEIKLIGDDSLKRIGQLVNLYVVNEGFAIPYVSPMLAESLGGLPPMLIVSSNIERSEGGVFFL